MVSTTTHITKLNHKIGTRIKILKGFIFFLINSSFQLESFFSNKDDKTELCVILTLEEKDLRVIFFIGETKICIIIIVGETKICVILNVGETKICVILIVGETKICFILIFFPLDIAK